MRCTFLLFLALVTTANAQPPFSAGSPSSALCGAALLEQDAWAAHNNPALLPGFGKFGMGLWTERPYNLKTLDHGAATLVIPFKKGKGGTLGAGFYAATGNGGFSRQKINLAYALKLSSAISAGVNLHLLQTRLSEYYGNKLTPVAEASIVYQLDLLNRIGLRLWNIYPVQLADYQNEKLPTVFQAGYRRTLGKKTRLSVQIDQESSQKTDLAMGLNYRPVQDVSLQLGFQTNPASYSFGLSFLYDNLNIHLAFGYHPVLGVSPNLGFTYAKEQFKD